MASRRKPNDSRLLVLGVAFVVAWAGIGFRLVRVQGFEADEHAARGEQQRRRTEDLSAPRGTIYDRDGVELAVSIDAITVTINPQEVDDVVALARELAPMVGEPRHVLRQRFTKPGSQFAYVARRLESAEAEVIRQFVRDNEISGVYFTSEPKRIYPAGDLASQVVGFVRDDDMAGLEGIEWKYDELLSGIPGQQIVERDPYGNPIPQGDFIVDPAQPGADLILTIDREIEFAAQQILAQAVADTNAVAGTVVVLDIDTGEVLAMASAPTFDPNDRSGTDPAAYRNRAVTDVYEPGSTLKVVTVAAALEEDVVTPRTSIKVPAKVEIGDKEYTDVGRKKARQMTVSDIVAQSSNVGTILIQDLLGNAEHYSYLSAFGLGAVASGDLPGEASGHLENVRNWCDTTCGPSTAIGYRVDVTPLQMASVFAAIANDGVWVQPHVVREVIRADGTRERFQPTERPVVSAETARTMRLMLQGVVETGTGTLAAIDSYTVGGKTGTTEKFVPGEGYSLEDRIASFIGIAPIDDPRIVVAVVLDSPNGELEDGSDLKFGGVSAAPVFAAVAEATLHRLGVPPDVR
ncbi:MAG: penicillin-binding protein 2 [Acidimicrobiia bacterium]|nr:penicillin-binding protein 2 [Acidimicrobiia bacterium]